MENQTQKPQVDTTMFKTFTSYSDLLKKTAGKRIYIRLANCNWFAPVQKSGLKMVADSMRENGRQFTGLVEYAGGGRPWAQVTMD